MISVFDTQPVILEEKDGHVLTVSRNGLLYKDSNGEWDSAFTLPEFEHQL